MKESESGTSLQPTKIWNRNFVQVFIANGLLQMSSQMCNTLLAVYLDDLGYVPTLVGFVIGIFAYASLVLRFVSAPVLDAFNRVKVVSVCVCLLAVSYLGYGLFAQLSLLVIARVLQGVALAFVTTGTLVLASDALPENQFSKGIAYFSVAQAICIALGPSLALMLSAVIGYSCIFFIDAGLALIAAIVMTRVKPRQYKKEKFHLSLKNALAKEAALPAVLYAFMMFTYMSILSFIVIFGQFQGFESSAGLFFTVYAVVMIVTRPLFGNLAEKFGEVKVLAPAFVVFGFSFYLISISTNLSLFLIAAVLAAASYGASAPVIQAACMKSVSIERRGAGSSTCYIGGDIGCILGPLVGGLLVDAFGYCAMWRLMIIPLVVAFVILIVGRKSFAKMDSSTQHL